MKVSPAKYFAAVACLGLAFWCVMKFAPRQPGGLYDAGPAKFDYRKTNLHETIHALESSAQWHLNQTTNHTRKRD